MAEAPKMRLKIRQRGTATPAEEPQRQSMNSGVINEETAVTPEIDESKLAPEPTLQGLAIPTFMKEKMEEAKNMGIESSVTEGVVIKNTARKVVKKEEPKVEVSAEETSVEVRVETADEKPTEAMEANPTAPAEDTKAEKFGELHNEGAHNKEAANEINLTHQVREIKSGKFFSEGHKKSVEANNLLVAATRSTGNPTNVLSEEEFKNILNNGLDSIKIKEGDADYATAASRPVISSVNTYYSVVCMHSGYKANMLGLHYLDKSRLNTVAEDMYSDRYRLFKIIFEKIESMTLGKPSFEEWLKMTALNDVPTLLYGIYSASYPTSQPFEIECNKCHKKTPINTDAESILAVYDKDAYKQITDILYNVKTRDDIRKSAPLYEINRIPIMEKRSIIEIREPSLWDFLEMTRFFKGKEAEYTDYETMVERAVFVKAVYIPDVALMESTGEKAMVKVTDPKVIIKFLANITEDESISKLDKATDDINAKYDVKFEIPAFKCNHLMEDENGMMTDKPCANDIGPIPLDMEELVFFRVRQALKKVNQ